MNAVIPSSAPPLVGLERNTWITQVLLDRLPAYSEPVFWVTDLHRCAFALGARRRSMPVLVLAGEPPESRWTDWNAQVQSVMPAPCPMMAVDCRRCPRSLLMRYPRVFRAPWISATPPWMSPVICGSQFIPPNVSLQDRRMAARSTGRNPLVTDHRFSARQLGLAPF